MSRSFMWEPEVRRPEGGSIGLGLAGGLAAGLGFGDALDRLDGVLIGRDALPVLNAIVAMGGPCKDEAAEMATAIRLHGGVVMGVSR